MIEVAGLILTGIGALKSLRDLHDDVHTWTREDLEVDRDWLPLALEQGLLDGGLSDYRFVRSNRASTLELEGTYRVIVGHDDEIKTFYRVVKGRPNDLSVLMKKAPPDP